MQTPSSTYRIQLNYQYSFKDVALIIDYLQKLGISTIYGSPICTALYHSSHGYDVTNPVTISNEIGTMEDLERLGEKLKSKNLTWLQDIVPNHMAFSQLNYWLMDVMERGKVSEFYNAFDINWNHQNANFKGKLMIPSLGNELDKCVENHEIKLVFNAQGFCIQYFDTEYPLSIGSYNLLLNNLGKSPSVDWLGCKLNLFIVQSSLLFHSDWLIYKTQFVLGIFEIETQKHTILQWIEILNTDKSLVNELLSKQNYALQWWKTAESEMNYRRFFTINNLICLRIEDERIFDMYHKFIKILNQKGLIQGVRIDHIDGLYDPKQYIHRLRNLLGDECYIVAEKILAENEVIPTDWALQGTTGYDFLAMTNKVLTNVQGASKMQAFYQTFVADTSTYDEIVYHNKIKFLCSQMGGELDNLMVMIGELKMYKTSIYSIENSRKALAIVMSCFPVYRLYVENLPLDAQSQEVMKYVFGKAIQKDANLLEEINFIKSLFDIQHDSEVNEQNLNFIVRLMQFTGPLAAKGVEDTTFYQYNALISQNEVGDSPKYLSSSISNFHIQMEQRQKNSPLSMNASSTHDTKRGEDARFRINALTDLADDWMVILPKWQNMNESYIQQINGRNAPSNNDAYFIYQSLIGSFPTDYSISESFLERTNAFIIKALKEAKTETTYTEPNEAYEQACVNFITNILTADHEFLQSFIPFLKKIDNYATHYSLLNTILKITAPGIPDIYQGCELWDFSYVDPDNRRKVDYGKRNDLLDLIIEKEKNNIPELLTFLKTPDNAEVNKLYVTYKLLNFRKQWNAVFAYGEYIPIHNFNENLIAYFRRLNDDWILVILPKTKEIGNQLVQESFKFNLPKEAPTKWHDIFTKQVLDTNQINIAQKLFSHLQFSVLKNI